MQQQAMLLLLLALASGASAAAATPPASISWLSQPVRANATVLVSGAGFGPGSVTLRGSSCSQADVSETGAAASFVLPLGEDDEYPRYTVSIDGSNELGLNEPQVWWFQGDKGLETYNVAVGRRCSVH
jgi:hypothetical protein